MFFSLILENSSGDRIDLTTTAGHYMTSKNSGLHPLPGNCTGFLHSGEKCFLP